MVACTTSCAVLFASAVFGTVFCHLNTGPELLGYVSTTWVTLGTQARLLRWMILMGWRCLLLKKQRFRYGVHQPGMNDRMGIGREEDIGAIGSRERQKGKPEEATSTNS